MPITLTEQIAQFYHRYPGGSLTAELVTIHGDTYAVRAIARAGAVLATAMAADATLEAAEDQAKARVLSCLRIGNPPLPSSPAPSSPVPSSPAPSSPAPSTPAPSSPIASDSAVVGPAIAPPNLTLEPSPAVPPPAPSADPAPAAPPVAPSPPADEFDLPPLSASIPGLDGDIALPAPESPAPKASAPPAPKASAAQRPSPQATQPKSKPSPPSKDQPKPAITPAVTPAVETLAPKDLSDIIVKTSVELKRLGWQEEEGRQHLQSVYGKRSRQHLTDQELVDFLRYLEQQPTPVTPRP